MSRTKNRHIKHIMHILMLFGLILIGCVLLPGKTANAADSTTTASTVEVQGIVQWDKSDETKLPKSVTLHLLQNGADTGKTTTATKTGNWAFTFGQQPLNDANGKAYEYNVKEDTVSGDTYTTTYDTPKYIEKADQLKLTFNGSSKTKGIFYDYIRIYYKDSNGNINMTNKLGGGNIANTSVVIPYGDFFLYLHSDSNSSAYGFKFESIKGTTGEMLAPVTAGTLPSVTATEKSGANYPEANTSYTQMWHYKPTVCIPRWNCVVNNVGKHIITSETWGTCPWKIYKQGGDTVLELQGGKGSDTSGVSPWSQYSSQITRVIVSKGATVELPSNSAKLFYQFTKATYIDASQMDVKNVKNMNCMFGGCINLESLDVSQWQTGNVTDMGFTFAMCAKLHDLNVSNWDTSSVTNMNSLFAGCAGLTTLILNAWNTSNVTDISYMFGSMADYLNDVTYNCDSLSYIDITGWNTQNVASMRSLFNECTSLHNINGISTINVENVTDMDYAFANCKALKSLDLNMWIPRNTTSMSSMFYGSTSLSSLYVSNWNTSNVKNMDGMFKECSALRSLDLSGWDTSNVGSMYEMFYGDTFITIGNSSASLNISNFDTSQVSNMTCMFANCSNLQTIDISNFNTTKVQYMDAMIAPSNSPYESTSLYKIVLGKNFVIPNKTIYTPIFPIPLTTSVGTEVASNTWGLNSEHEDKTYSNTELQTRGQTLGALNGTWWSQWDAYVLFDDSTKSDISSIEWSEHDEVDTVIFTSTLPESEQYYFNKHYSSISSRGHTYEWTEVDDHYNSILYIYIPTTYQEVRITGSAFSNADLKTIKYEDFFKDWKRVADANGSKLTGDDTNNELSGTWKKNVVLHYSKDADGDETYISQDIISGQTDSSKSYYDADDDTYDE